MSRPELEAAHAWEAEDRVPGRPEMTEFRRNLRLHQTRWREAHGHPIGSQPIAPRPGKPARPVGSRLPLEYARRTGASFVTVGALGAARARTSQIEPRQSFDHQRLWADLLWSPALALNLFGDIDRDGFVARWWPDATGAAQEVRFVHSPGWLDPAYLASLRAFDAAFVLEGGGIIGVDVQYHERAKPETPKPENMRRYLAVAERSGAFAPGALDSVTGRSDLAVMWLEHLLLHSMLQHESGAWTWGRYVVVHPAGNKDVADLCARYRALLQDDSTFSSLTLEELLDAGVHSSADAVALRERYVPSAPVKTTATRSPESSAP
jgi:PD-(D/E)XK nuclease superfamily protein